MPSLLLGSSSFVLAFLSALSGLAAARERTAALVTIRLVWLLLSAGGSKLSAWMSLHGHQLQQLQQHTPLVAAAAPMIDA